MISVDPPHPKFWSQSDTVVSLPLSTSRMSFVGPDKYLDKSKTISLPASFASSPDSPIRNMVDPKARGLVRVSVAT